MKVKVLRKFIDRKEKAVRQPGEVFECTPERYNEIMSKNRLIEPFEEEKQKRESAESETEQVQAEKAPEQSEVDEEKPAKAKTTKKK
ncbi:hypothetical protein [uncultured Eubacterium sp.]|uniref:hypothetical protein n=1 Tax=uncultured Eubacterium sp. TaxID=165185 RepID=UPI0025988E8D|nr:hypothetical protein [uncultured Eubacterium sp.]